jgi:GntR family transcriptional regulator/MocR family aminotransferase
VLDYGDPRGSARLRAALAEMLARARGLAVDESSLLVTRGSQMALWLAAHALVAPGDVVAVEALGYRPAWDALRAAGARLEPLPVDRGGLRVDALAALCTRRSLRALYLTPHHQYPTTVTLTAPRRIELLRLARRHRFAVLEDDYDHEFHYQGRPVLPLASADPGGSVVYVGTLSKVLAPALRLGYLVAPPPLIERLAAERVLVDRQGDRVLEEAVAELLEEGEVQRHVRRVRRIYRARRDILATELTARLGDRVRFALPSGGMALWCEAPGIDTTAWEARALAAGVGFQAARRFTFDGRPRAAARLGFAPIDERAIVEAVRRLAAVIDA